AGAAHAEPKHVEKGNDPHGLVYDGLQQSAAGGACHGTFEVAGKAKSGEALCTHGPDPAPDGVDVRVDRAPEPATVNALDGGSGVAAATAGVQCYGTGSDGYRVQLIYARASDVADRYATYAASFAQWAANVDLMTDASAAETGGSRHVRFVTDGSCTPIVDRV